MQVKKWNEKVAESMTIVINSTFSLFFQYHFSLHRVINIRNHRSGKRHQRLWLTKPAAFPGIIVRLAEHRFSGIRHEHNYCAVT
jgi:hypothetical protein